MVKKAIINENHTQYQFGKRRHRRINKRTVVSEFKINQGDFINLQVSNVEQLILVVVSPSPAFVKAVIHTVYVELGFKKNNSIFRLYGSSISVTTLFRSW